MWNDGDSSIVVLDSMDGSTILELEHAHRIRHIDSAGSNIALGDSGGRIHLVEGRFLSRRLEDDEESGDDERRSRLMERLRKLREV